MQVWVCISINWVKSHPLMIFIKGDSEKQWLSPKVYILLQMEIVDETITIVVIGFPEKILIPIFIIATVTVTLIC